MAAPTIHHFQCDHCSRVFTRKYNLQAHIERCHSQNDFYCDACDQKYPSLNVLQLHLAKGHNSYGQDLPECDYCGRIFARKQNISSHMITVHMRGVGQSVSCEVCCKKFTTQRNLNRHVKLIHDPTKERPCCEECNRYFKDRDALIVHEQNVHHPELKDFYKCDMCGRGYISKRNLKRHIELQHGRRVKFPCKACSKVFASIHGLKRHTKTHHTVDNLAEFSCKLCAKSIIGKENLSNHVSLYHKHENIDENCERIYEKMSGFTCDVCGSLHVEEASLRRHVKTEHSFQDFYSYCRKTLIKTALADAEKLKQLKSGYKCDLCGECFGTFYALKDHIKAEHNEDYKYSSCNVCFAKFFCKDTLDEHRSTCIPPKNTHSCSHCDKLFTDISSLKFHTRIFHPQFGVDTNDSSSTLDEKEGPVDHQSLKHHIKSEQSINEAVASNFYKKMCRNNLNNEEGLKCDYCDKIFKSKRNIRRHIEATHLGTRRYECLECGTLFKEQRSLRKHVRAKHPNSTKFPQCHLCKERFESARSCHLHLKIQHSVSSNTHPCDICPISFTSIRALNKHLSTDHLAKDQIYKCERCNVVCKGHDQFGKHKENCHLKPMATPHNLLPRCIICEKNFSSSRTLKRHIKNFHVEFSVEELANYGSRTRNFIVDCAECIKNFNDDVYVNIYQTIKSVPESIVFKCNHCVTSYSSLEFAVQRCKLNFGVSNAKMYLGELCTTEMREDDSHNFYTNEDAMVPEDTMNKMETEHLHSCIKIEPMTP